MGIFNDLGNAFESDEEVKIPEFLIRNGNKYDEYENLNNINISNREIKLLCMDNIGKDIVEKIKHIGNDEVECILISENKQELELSSADNKIFIDREKNLSDYFDIIDDIIDSSCLIVQVMDLGTYISTSLTDRINYLCKKRGKKIAYIAISPFLFLGKSLVQSANDQKDELKDEHILIFDNQELIQTVEKNTSLDDSVAGRNKLIINAIDYIIEKRDVCEVRTL